MKLTDTQLIVLNNAAQRSTMLALPLDEGHCGLPADTLRPLAGELLEVPEELVQTALELELSEGVVTCDQVGETNCIFLAGLYRAEQTIAERLKALLNGKLPWPWIDPDKALPWIEQKTGLALAERQNEAIRLALKAKVCVITGGPGVGKTTIVNSILRIGYVEDVDVDTGELTANFDGRSVTYGFGELDTLVPAYAATIHKSQGSEYPAVVIPVMTQHYAMLQRNLIYTGVTRGKKLVVLVGQPKAVAIAVKNVSGRRRWTKLKEWLSSV